MDVAKVDVGVEGEGDVKVEGVVVGVAVEDVDGDDAGEVRPPQVQAPSVPRGIYKERHISHHCNNVIAIFQLFEFRPKASDESVHCPKLTLAQANMRV